MKILFYISGHGLGHAARVVAVMKALVSKAPTVHIYARTQVSSNVFDGLPAESLHHSHAAIDAGVVEKDIFSQDIHATLRAYAGISESKREIIANEVSFVRRERVDIIVGDIPPLASEIRDEAGIPTLAIGNFSWDFIYEPYIRQYSQFA